MIFVHIASYRDPECRPTINDLLTKAKFPDDLRIVLTLQSNEEDHQHFYHEKVTTISLPHHISKGACWARCLGYQLYDNEDYILQIDSHMRFVEHWDEKLLQHLNRCQASKPLLTTYPGAYEPPDNYVGGTSPVFLVADRFDDTGRLLQKGSIPSSNPSDPPRMSALLSGNFIFAPGSWVTEVPYDQLLYFSGEEPTLAVRSWTHGWDMFGPTEAILWHRYGRSDRKLHWDDHKTWYINDASSLERYRKLMSGQDHGPYGLGSDRSLEQYQTFSGIDFTQHTLTEFAKEGLWALEPITRLEP